MCKVRRPAPCRSSRCPVKDFLHRHADQPGAACGRRLDSAALVGDAGGGAHQHQKAAMAANDKSGFWNDWKTKHPRWHQLLVLVLASIAGLLVVGLIWLRRADIW